MKEKFVKVRRVESTTYDIFKIEEDKLILLGSREISGRINKTAIASEYGVDEVVLRKTGENVKVYGVPVEMFMNIAVEITE